MTWKTTPTQSNTMQVYFWFVLIFVFFCTMHCDTIMYTVQWILTSLDAFFIIILESMFLGGGEHSNPIFLNNFFKFSLSIHNSVNQLMVDHWLCLFTEGVVNHLDIQITSRLKPEMFLDSCRTTLIAFRVTCLVAFNQHVVNFVKFMGTSTY